MGPHWNSITYIITEAPSYVCIAYTNILLSILIFQGTLHVLPRTAFIGGYLIFLSYFIPYSKRSFYFTDSCSQDIIDYILSVWNLCNKITGFLTIRKEWKDRVGKTNSRHSANQIRTRLMSLPALIILLFLSIVCITLLFLKKMFLQSFSEFVYPWG